MHLPPETCTKSAPLRTLSGDSEPWVPTAHASSPEARGDGGQKYDQGKPRTDLLPFDALTEVAAVLGYGAEKYSARNWERGITWGRLLGALLRHTYAWAGGEEHDGESGHRHLAHAACCALMLLALTMRGVGTDDRARGDR